MLRFAGVNKRFGGVEALADCAFAVARGRMVGFLGPNGAGKTTSMRAIFGLVELDAGDVSWDGHTIGFTDRLRFGYMPEERGLSRSSLRRWCTHRICLCSTNLSPASTR